jgi:hypothetical protein
LLYASGATALSKLADVAVGSYLRSGGVTTAPLWSTLILPNTSTANRFVYSSATNAYGESANATYDGTTFIFAGAVKIGTNTPGSGGVGLKGTTASTTAAVAYTETGTDLAAAYQGINALLIHSITADNAFATTCGLFEARITAATTKNASAQSYGVRGICRATGAGNVTGYLTGMSGFCNNTGSGTVSNAIACDVQSAGNSGGGVITNNYGFYINNQSVGVSNYGIYINQSTAAAANYALYNASANGKIFSAAPIFIGSNTAGLTGVAGLAAFQVDLTASTGNILIPQTTNDANGPTLEFLKRRVAFSTVTASGDFLGSIYFDGADGTDAAPGPRIQGKATEAWSGTASGSQLIFSTVPNTTQTLTTAVTIGQDQSMTVVGGVTIGGGTKILKVLSASATLDFGSTIAGASTDLTITVTGAALGDTVAVGVPNGSVGANGDFWGWVSATNTVTIRFTNPNLVTTLDPASGTFRATVFQF